MQQTVLGATCSFSCHPEYDHQDVHHIPASADGDHPNQGPLKEVKGQCGGEGGRKSQLQAIMCTGGAVTVPPKAKCVRIIFWKFETSVFFLILMYSYSRLEKKTFFVNSEILGIQIWRQI